MRREYRLPPEDEAYLDAQGCRWETIQPAGAQWLLVHDFRIPTGYTVDSATVAIRIGGAYPPAELDMAYFHPALKRTDEIVVRKTDGTVAIEGVQFQQWSRHRTPANPWRVGVDNVGTHLSLVEHWLEREIVRK